MAQNKYINIDEAILQNILDLAERREIEENARDSDGVTSGEMKVLPESAESLALGHAVDALTSNQAAELHAAMYLGRDSLDGETAKNSFTWQREIAAGRSEQEIKDSLLKIIQLATYVKTGLKRIAEE